jgi:16S rRNA (cytosine1402-N4)-methyltransferase
MDEAALEASARQLQPFGDRVELEHCRFSGLARRLRKLRHGRAGGWLMDLGASSLQLDRPERGFSFQFDGPLDMRMDPSRERTAADIVNQWDETDLADLFFYEGGERRSRQLAQAIVEARRRAPFLRTGGLADLVERVTGQGGRLHAATKVFQALRRAVNEEGDEQRAGLEAAESWLADGGVLAVISFHSGEDGVVKRFFQAGVQEGRWRLLTKKPVRPDHAEERRNARARSARLRAGVRVREADPVRGATQDATARTLAERPPVDGGTGDEKGGEA